MTKQEYLDLLVATSAAGGFPALGCSYSEGCAYRGKNGRKCAVGLLIPDEKYTPEMEGSNTASSSWRENYEAAVTIPEGMSYKDLGWVQGVHDSRPESPDGKWMHDVFVKKLLTLPFFAGMTPTPRG